MKVYEIVFIDTLSKSTNVYNNWNNKTSYPFNLTILTLEAHRCHFNKNLMKL